MFSFSSSSKREKVTELLRRMNARYPDYKLQFDGLDHDWPIIRGRMAYFPGSALPEDTIEALELIAYAYAEIAERSARPVLFWMLSWFPRYFVVFSFSSILAIGFGIGWLTSLLAIVFLFLPRIFDRAMRVNRMASPLAARLWTQGVIHDEVKERYTKLILSYGFGIEESESIVQELIGFVRVDSVLGETVLDDSNVFCDIYEVLTGIDLDYDNIDMESNHA
jgi:hypothetical protein